MKENKILFSPGVIFKLLVFILLYPCLPLLISRHWNWWEAWFYALFSILGFAFSRLLAARRNPDLIVERSKFLQQPDAIHWDKHIAPLVGLGGAVLPIVAGLDALFSWSIPFHDTIKFSALLVFLLGYAFSSWALIENRFFSGMVRLQTDRQHTVVSSGPYRLVRHPGYAGAMLTYLAIPFFLDSSWAIIPALLLIILLVIRTSLEDEFLHSNLPGYREYAKNTRFRLLPGVW